MELPFGKEQGTPRSFWQERFYDFNVYSQKKKSRKAAHTHANPVNRKLAWSSWSFYQGKRALLELDAQ
jgi:hypothetical protein